MDDGASFIAHVVRLLVPPSSKEAGFDVDELAVRIKRELLDDCIDYVVHVLVKVLVDSDLPTGIIMGVRYEVHVDFTGYDLSSRVVPSRLRRYVRWKEEPRSAGDFFAQRSMVGIFHSTPVFATVISDLARDALAAEADAEHKAEARRRSFMFYFVAFKTKKNEKKGENEFRVESFMHALILPFNEIRKRMRERGWGMLGKFRKVYMFT